MTQTQLNRSTILVAVLGIPVVFSGCSGPRFKKQQEARDARIKDHLSAYAAHDAAGPDRIRQTLDLDKKLKERRAEHLAQTCELIRSLHERDVRRWEEEEPLRKARLEALLRGKPEEIDDAWAKMVY